MKANEYFKKMGWNISNIRLAELEQNKEFNEFYYDLKKIIESHSLVDECGGIESCRKKFSVREKFKPKAEYFAIHHEKPHLIQMYARNQPKIIPNYSFKKLQEAMIVVESCM